MKKYETTSQERAIIGRLPIGRIEEWINKKEYWRAYQIIIQITKEYLEKTPKQKGVKPKDTNIGKEVVKALLQEVQER